MVSTVLDPRSDPTSESFVGKNTPSLGMWALRQSHHKADLELNSRTESSKRDVLRDPEAPDIIRGRHRNLDDNHPIDGIPLIQIRLVLSYHGQRDQRIVLFSFRARPLRDLLTISDAPQAIAKSVGGVG